MQSYLTRRTGHVYVFVDKCNFVDASNDNAIGHIMLEMSVFTER
jgi:hypothetical protein